MWDKIKVFIGWSALAVIVGFSFLGGTSSEKPSANTNNCDTETVYADEHETSSDKLPDGEYLVVIEPDNGEDKVCRSKDGAEVSREVVTEKRDKVTLSGTGQVPEGYDGIYSEQDVVEDFTEHGELTRTYFGEYDQEAETPVYSGARTGAECNDGSYSDATGRGACSHHGGVAVWLYN